MVSCRGIEEFSITLFRDGATDQVDLMLPKIPIV